MWLEMSSRVKFLKLEFATRVLPIEVSLGSGWLDLLKSAYCLRHIPDHLDSLLHLFQYPIYFISASQEGL